MKKILLGTTTLIGAAGMFAGAALADTPKVTIGGYENFEVGYVDDTLSSAAKNAAANDGSDVSQRPDAFRSDTEVDFKIDGKSDAGLGYGGEADLLADTSGDVQNRGINASKTFIYLDGNNWGRFELGSNVGADGTMKVDAGTIARATGGIDGDWSYFANAATQYLAMASLPLGYGNLNPAVGNNYLGDHSEENIDKVTYYTPRFAGFQLGVSFMPDTINRGQGGNSTVGSTAGVGINPLGPNRTDVAGYDQDVWSGGLGYQTKVYSVGVDLAATGEYGKADSNVGATNYEDLRAYEAGGKLSYMGWSLAGSYGNWGKSDTGVADNAKDTWFWDGGVAYETGPVGVSVTYLQSSFDCGTAIAAAGNNSACVTVGKDKFRNISTGVDYKLAPGLTPYAEISFYDENAPGTVNDNKGEVGIVGTQLNF